MISLLLDGVGSCCFFDSSVGDVPLNRFLFSSEGGVTGSVFVVVVVGLGRWCYSFGSRCCFFVAVFVVVVLPR